VTGLFNTRLRITDINGCQDSIAQPLPVGGPRAGLGATNPTGCRGITVNFIVSSRSDGVNPIIQRIWDFGDGTVQTINNPPYQHTYTVPGTYSVKLKIIDAGGCTGRFYGGLLAVLPWCRSAFYQPHQPGRRQYQ
jgi:PKD repeat protein